MSLSNNQLWLIRHGERADETEEYKEWQSTSAIDRLFDPPLTKNGKLQACLRGQLLRQHLEEIGWTNDWSHIIYVSPCERTLQTAFEIAKQLLSDQLTTITLQVRPGLSECATAVQDRGIEKSNHGELYLKQVSQETIHFRFLQKKEVLQQLCLDSKDSTSISWQFCYDDQYIHENFQQSVENILKDNTSHKFVLCITHREGIRLLDYRLGRTRIPYCGLAKYLYSPIKNTHDVESNAQAEQHQSFQFLID
ncbi:hypothetical protein RFI_04747 [Reticulomyxa filosa]|uniref:Phosphoglycerate mutase n=1 Tax=Reticulomyxa filosa TaxID=46433 RepID=X6P2F5_RETFI|nr:hypothetical protein RFI_04747 [Reticulomyxa filosa]|eukprot:ETO32371.1 hypothetical protein RFI_04747 [Reticulomyxa filosa]